jgi:hypothetical protein
MRTFKWVLWILLAVGLLFAAKNFIAKVIISGAVGVMTGLPLQIQQMQMEVFRSHLQMEGVKLFNPVGFPDKVMVDLPELYVDYDLGAFFKGQTHLKELRIDLEEFVVVKNEQGQLNLDSIQAVKELKTRKGMKPSSEEKGEPAAFLVDFLELRVGRVIYKDYSGGTPPLVREFQVDLHERYRNITDPHALAGLIVTRTLVKTTIANLANFELKMLQSEVTSLLGRSAGFITGTADTAGGSVMEEAAQTLRKFLPIGE